MLILAYVQYIFMSTYLSVMENIYTYIHIILCLVSIAQQLTKLPVIIQTQSNTHQMPHTTVKTINL